MMLKQKEFTTAQIAEMNSRDDLISAQVLHTNAQTALAEAQADLTAAEQSKIVPLNLLVAAQTANEEAKTALTEAEIDAMPTKLILLQAQADAETAKAVLYPAQVTLTEAQAAAETAKTNTLIPKQATLLDKQAANTDAQTDHTAAQTAVVPILFCRCIMGLFDSETKITVSAVTFNLIDKAPNRMREAAAYALISGNNLVETVMSSMVNGFAYQAKQAYDYANEHYTLGLPNGEIQGLPIADHAAVKAAIDADYPGADSAVIYAFIGHLSGEAALVEWLRNNRGYKLGSSTITVHPFTLYSPQHGKLRIDRTEYLSETHEIKIIYKEYYNLVSHYAEHYDIVPAPVGLVLGDLYCCAAFKLFNSSLGTYSEEEYYWFYRLADKTHEGITYDPVGFGAYAYMPIVPLRRDNIDLTDASRSSTELFTTSKKLLKKMSLDFENLGDKINENPSVAQIDHAYVMFGIDIMTDKPASLRYLCEYFDYLSDVDIFDKNDTANFWQEYTKVKRNTNTFIFKRLDAEIPRIVIQDYGLDISITYGHITSVIYQGSIGPVGTCTRQVILDKVKLSTFMFADRSQLILRQQINEHQYRCITVYIPRHVNSIYQGHGIMSTLYASSTDPENESFIIPLHYGIAKALPLKERNELYYDSCRLVLNSYEVQKIRWYQKNFFKGIFVFIAAVIAAWSGQGWLVKLGMAIGAGAMAVAMFLLESIIISVVISIAAKLFVRMVGGELAIIIGIVVTIYAISRGNMGSFQFLGQTIPTAQSLIQMSSALISGSQDWINSELQTVQEESQQFAKEAEEKIDMLEEAQALLEMDIKLSPMAMLATTQPSTQLDRTLIETPDEFFNRTIHAGNIGVLTLDVVENYAKIMLNLPEVRYV